MFPSHCLATRVTALIKASNQNRVENWGAPQSQLARYALGEEDRAFAYGNHIADADALATFIVDVMDANADLWRTVVPDREGMKEE